MVSLCYQIPAPEFTTSSDSSPPPPPAWLRVVVEKPFGNDLESAQAMSRDLLKHLQDEELYRIDHYLGGSSVYRLPVRWLGWVDHCAALHLCDC